MKIKNILHIVFLVHLMYSCSSNLAYNSIKTSSKCSDKSGYWYNNTCWKDFKDEGISKIKIDSTVSAQMQIIKKLKIIMDNQTYPLISFIPIKQDKNIVLIATYGTKNNYKTLIFPTRKKKLKKEVLKTATILFDGDAIAKTLDENSKLNGTAKVNIVDVENLRIEISGNIFNDKNNNTKNFTFKTDLSIVGSGNSHIKIKENEAYLSGYLGTITYSQIKNLIKTNPEVKTIIMTNISGSVNDAVNMHTGRLLHENGFTTKVLSGSDIASGGVDLFCAGKKRIVEKGAKIGIHSWCCVNNLTAIEVPKEHPAHQYQLEYFNMALGSKKGSDFYFHTLEASPFDDIHYMTDEEIKKWHIATKFIKGSNYRQ